MLLLYLLAVAVLLLSIPIYLSFDVRHGPAPRAAFAIVWLFGLVRIPLKPGGPKPPPKPKPRRPPKKKRAGRVPPRVVSAIRSPAFRRRALKLFRQLLAALRLPALRLHLKLGLDDPADTGLLWALLGPASLLLGALPKSDIRLEPSFHAPVLELHARGQAGLIPAQILFLCLAFLFSPVTLRALAVKGARA